MTACSTPSSSVDGGDLLGVFERDAGADAAASAARSASNGGAGSEVLASPARARPSADLDGGAGAARTPEGRAPRAPTEGNCLAEQGRPGRELRRTLGRPPCRGAQVLEWRDAEGSPRYACVTAPSGVETRAPLPLIVFFHGEQDNPSSVDKKTGLRKLGGSFNLTGDPAHAGFIVLAPQGRAFKASTQGERQRGAAARAAGAPFDTEYTGEDNVDVAAVDHFIGELTQQKLVDRARIYTLGASYGGHMAATYAMMRADRVAAFATYASDAPPAEWSCPSPPPPAMVLYRACDDAFPCDSVERWLRARDALSAETPFLRLDEAGKEEPHCALRNRCSPLKASLSHARWPTQREPEILRFFAGTPSRAARAAGNHRRRGARRVLGPRRRGGAALDRRGVEPAGRSA